MSKFNSKVVAPKIAIKGQKNSLGTVENHEGAKSFKLSSELELYSAVCTAILQDKFYEGSDELLGRIRNLISKVDHEFVAKLAAYAREQMYLRSVPLVLAVELAKVHRGDDLVRRMTRRVIARADELSEILAYYVQANGRKIGDSQTKSLNKLSKQLSKGVADAFQKFDAYSLKKYNASKEIKLRDVINLVHPVPKDEEQSEVFKKILAGELESVDTWETKAGIAGQEVLAKATELKLSDEEKAKLKASEMKKMWEDKIDAEGRGQLGYMAMLRNIMNFLKYDVSVDHIVKVCNRLSDPKAVEKSKQLPFRFLTAYRMLTNRQLNYLTKPAKPKVRTRIMDFGILPLSSVNLSSVRLSKTDDMRINLLLEALEGAAIAACKNVPSFGYEDRILIAADTSGSMQKPISVVKNNRTGEVISSSLVQYYDIGLMLAMMLRHKCKMVTCGMFGNYFATFNVPSDQILTNTDRLHSMEGVVGYSTNGYIIMEYAIHAASKNIFYDKVFIFSDNQFWNSTRMINDMDDMDNTNRLWKKYKTLNPTAKLYVFDLSGYGTVPVSMNDGDVFFISGWSDRIFEMLDSIENGEGVLEKIKAIQL